MLKILLLTFSVLLLASGYVQAQKKITTAQQYDVKSLTLKSGLVQSSVRGIVQDRRGLIWLGTEAGVQIFDGLHLKRLDQIVDGEVAPSIPSLFVNQLFESSNGSILIATRHNGLIKFDQTLRTLQQFSLLAFTEHVQDKTPFYDVCEDKHQNLWAATDRGLLQLNQITGSWKVILPSKITNRFTDVACLDDSIIARRGSELIKWHLSNDKIDVLPIQSNIDSYDSLLIKAIKPGYTLVGKEDGLFRLSNDFSRLIKIWPKNQVDENEVADNNIVLSQEAAVNDILYHNDEALWLGTAFHGLLLIEFTSGKVLKKLESLPDNQFSLSGNHVLRLMRDHSNLVWASIYGFGVDRLLMSQTAMKTYFTYTDSPLEDNDITAITQGMDDSLWFAVNRSGVRRLSLTDMSSTDFTQTLVDIYQAYAPNELPYISDIEIDGLNRLWFTSNKGIFRVNITTLHSRFYPREKNNPNGPRARGRDIFIDNKGLLYITDEGAILRYDKTTDSFIRIPLSDKTSSDFFARIKAVQQHDDGTIYALGAQNIYRLTDNRVLVPIMADGQLTTVFGGRFSDFVINQEGDFYIAAQGGLIKVNMSSPSAPQPIVYTDNAIPDNYFYALELDKSENLWLSTNNGIVHFDSQSHQYKQFSLSDGVLTREFNGRASFKRSNGHIIFGGIDGWTVVAPEQIILNKSTPRLALSSYQVGSQPAQAFLPDGGIEMNYGDHWLQFSFSALDFHSPEENHYSYYLEGFDPGWRSFGHKSEISFTGLPPGKYTLHARAATKRGNWHPQPLSIELRVFPPFYRSKVAFVGYALFVILLIAASIWRRKKLSRERAHYIELIETSQQRMKLALWGSGDSIWDWHINDDEIYRTSLHFLGYDDEQMANTIGAFKALIHPDDLASFEYELGEVLACHTAEYAAQYRLKDRQGNWCWVADQGKVVEATAAKKPVRISGTIRDIALIKRHEQELEKLNSELEYKIAERTQAFANQNEHLSDTLGNLKNTQDQLVESEKMASLGNLVAGISHEINTPVGVALTAASHNTLAIEQLQELFIQRKLTVKDMEKGLSQLKTSNELIESAINRTAQLIQTFKQVAVDHDQHEWRIIELPIYLIDIVPTFNAQLDNNRFSLEVFDGPFFDVECAPGDLYQIISQLVNNSVHHGFAGLKRGKITIKTELKDNHWTLRYHDNGNGMDSETREHIFEPFYTTRRGDGYAGLGMHLVFNIVSHSLGGTIKCDSEPAKGIDLTITLPLRKPDESQLSSPP